MPGIDMNAPQPDPSDMSEAFMSLQDQFESFQKQSFEKLHEEIFKSVYADLIKQEIQLRYAFRLCAEILDRSPFHCMMAKRAARWN